MALFLAATLSRGSSVGGGGGGEEYEEGGEEQEGRNAQPLHSLHHHLWGHEERYRSPHSVQKQRDAHQHDQGMAESAANMETTTN